jgi:hypothetical protein
MQSTSDEVEPRPGEPAVRVALRRSGGDEGTEPAAAEPESEEEGYGYGV